MEEEVMSNYSEDVVKKENRFIKFFTIIAIAVFVFSLYFFVVSSFNVKENSVKELENQGAVFYTLNLANPFSILGGVNLTLLVTILIVVIAIILAIIIVIVYYKIKRVKKIKIEQEKIAMELNPNAEKIEMQDSGNVSFYNNKVLELLGDGNNLLNKRQFADARINYHKIRQWYNPRDDADKEIYLKILRYYERIVKEEI